MEGGVCEMLSNVKLCKRDKDCETCASIRELREEQEIDSLLHPRRKSKKSKEPSDPAPADHSASEIEIAEVFKLPLEKPMCDNTTKFSKFIYKRVPHLRGKIGQCS